MESSAIYLPCRKLNIVHRHIVVTGSTALSSWKSSCQLHVKDTVLPGKTSAAIENCTATINTTVRKYCVNVSSTVDCSAACTHKYSVETCHLLLPTRATDIRINLLGKAIYQCVCAAWHNNFIEIRNTKFAIVSTL